MRELLSLKHVLALLVLGIMFNNVFSQGMKKPDPVKNETADMLMGNWVSEPWEMMGEKWTDAANHYMKYGQFLCIDITGSNDKGETYNGTIVLKLSNDGSFTGYSFDDWGSVSTYTGTAKGNKITVNGKSEWGTETRDITINGNTMVHKITMTMKGQDGKDMTMSSEVTYKKQ